VIAVCCIGSSPGSKGHDGYASERLAQTGVGGSESPQGNAGSTGVRLLREHGPLIPRAKGGATHPDKPANDTIDSQKALSVSKRLEPPHLPLSKSDSFIRNFSTIVGPSVGIVRD
jgi:hypothetical protein